jgi:hypothetical protein
MIRSFFIHIGLICIFLGTALTFLFHFNLTYTATPLGPVSTLPKGSIALVPLDSRPPCTDYVQQLALMAGYQVTLPPVGLLDNYRHPGNTVALRDWLAQEVSRSDTAIISVDMLVHGGLLASRQENASPAAIADVIELLKVLHQNHPGVRLYAFNIIPRLFIADNPLTDKFKPLMSEWSILQETVLLFENPRDFSRLQKIETDLPIELIQRYRRLYAENVQLNFQLLKLIQTGVLAGLVLGQDDSASFGLANLERQRLEHFVSNNPELQDKVFITRGTDEVALSLLGQAIVSPLGRKTKVFVYYTEALTADIIMPYMPGPLSRSVAEKLKLSNAEQSESIENADYILAIHAGTLRSSAKNLANAADQIKFWLDAGKNVALVDLAEDWQATQTLLPFLQKNAAPFDRLIAYAGWNTASNSIGTAVTQASMVLDGRVKATPPQQLSRDLQRVEFLASRIIDDWYYQKSFRPILNDSLQRQAINPYDLQSARTKVNRKIESELTSALPRLIQRNWQNTIFTLPAATNYSYAIDGWQLHSKLPWARTFEIKIDLTPQPAIINPK